MKKLFSIYLIAILFLGVPFGNSYAWTLGDVQEKISLTESLKNIWNYFAPDSWDFKPMISLGTATGSGAFTTSFNNFQDGDVINAGDWNVIEYTIGTTTPPTGGFSSSTATSTLWYKLTTSTDPGHRHTSSTVDGVIGVANGGTATTSFSNGLVVASGTDAFSSLQTNSNGSIPIASGSQWSAQTITAGSNVTVTNAAGSITIASVQGTFGDGSDGAVTISATTTLSRDMYYNGLTVNSGITLYTGGYRIFDKGTLTNGGIIANNGGGGSNGSSGTGGAAGSSASSTTAGFMGSCSAGANGTASNGVTPTITNVGGSVRPGFGADGVKGGTGGSTSNTTGGSAGNLGSSTRSTALAFEPKFFATLTTSTLDATQNGTTTLRQVAVFWQYASSSAFIGGTAGSSGGGGGGGDTGSQGGGGGGAGCPGGVIEIIASTLANNGTIRAKGGNGGNGAAGTGGAGGGGAGGGGGSGGLILLGYSTLSAIGTLDVSGGTQGTGAAGAGSGNAGADGTVGNTGKVYRLFIN